MTTQMTARTIETTAAVIVDNNPFSRATLESWIKFCDVRPSTQKTYDKAICRLVEFFVNHNISEPTRDDIIAFRKYMTDEDNNFENPIYKPGTSRLYLTIVKKFFGWLASEGIYLNIAAGVKLPEAETEHAHDPLTVEEAKATLASFKANDERTLRDKCLMALMIGCGLRSCECVRLDIGDMEKRSGRWFLQIHGKKRSGKGEKVALTAELKKLIDDYLAVRPAGKKNSPLFISTSTRNRGDRIQTQVVSRLAKRVFAKIGVESPRVTCHSCRATHATLALKAGLPIREVAKNLRHRSTQVTEIYASDLNAFNNRSVATVCNLIFSS